MQYLQASKIISQLAKITKMQSTFKWHEVSVFLASHLSNIAQFYMLNLITSLTNQNLASWFEYISFFFKILIKPKNIHFLAGNFSMTTLTLFYQHFSKKILKARRTLGKTCNALASHYSSGQRLIAGVALLWRRHRTFQTHSLAEYKQ